MIEEILVSQGDRELVSTLCGTLLNEVKGLPEAEVASAARIRAEFLPLSIRAALLEFVHKDAAPAICFRSLTTLSSECGDSPARPSQAREVSNSVQACLAMIMSLTGRLVAYSGQQNGRIFNDVVPVPEMANVPNSSSGSAEDFDFHTEDAYHDYPPDYVGLYCIRNLEKAETLVSWITPHAMPREVFALLSSPIIANLPNSGSLMNEGQAVPRPIVFGESEWPYLQVNLARLGGAKVGEVADAVAWLRQHLSANAVTIVLEPDDLIILNNLRAVHGRRSFRSTDGPRRRWLIRTLTRTDARRPPSRRDGSEYRFTL